MEYGSSFPATRAFGVVRSLFDTVYNMNMAHLTRAPKTVFEHLDDAGLRTACTTWLIYRGRTGTSPSGASVYRRIAEAAQFRHAVYGARELFYADLFDSRDTGCTSALGHAGPARPPRRLRGRLPGRERPLRLHALLAARQRHLLAQGGARRPGALDRRGRPRARAAHARGRRRGRVPGGARRDRDVRPLADQGGGRASTSPRRSPPGGCSRRPTRRPTEAEMAVCPAARSAHGLRARRGRAATSWCPRAVETCWSSRAWTWWCAGRRTGRRRALRPRRALASARRRSDRCARRSAGRVEGDHDALGLAVADGDGDAATSTRTRSAGCGPPLDCPHAGRRAGVGRRRATSSWTGAARTTWAAAATARSTATTREGVLLHVRRSDAPRARAVVAGRT